MIFNCDPLDYIKLMFYTDYIAYPKLPNDTLLNIAFSKGYNVAILEHGIIRDQILQNPLIKKIKRLSDRITSIDTVHMQLSNNHYLTINSEAELLPGVNATPFIVTRYADNTCKLQDLSGRIATNFSNWSNSILFNQTKYKLYEKFVITEKNGMYAIRTIFNEDLVIPNEKENFYASRHEDRSLEVKFIKAVKK